jgi:hypothetical protein
MSGESLTARRLVNNAVGGYSLSRLYRQTEYGSAAANGFLLRKRGTRFLLRRKTSSPFIAIPDYKEIVRGCRYYSL